MRPKRKCRRQKAEARRQKPDVRRHSQLETPNPKLKTAAAAPAAQLSLGHLEDDAAGDAPFNPLRSWTINSLWRETGIDRRTIEKRISDAHLEPVAFEELGNRRAPLYAGPDVFPVILVNGDRKGKNGNAYHRLIAAKAAQEERKERIAARLEKETYIESNRVEQLFSTLMNKLEAIPSKLESEFGLPAPAIRRLIELLDEARSDTACTLKSNTKLGSTEQ